MLLPPVRSRPYRLSICGRGVWSFLPAYRCVDALVSPAIRDIIPPEGRCESFPSPGNAPGALLSLLSFNSDIKESLSFGPGTSEAELGCAFQLLPPPPLPFIPARKIFSLDPGDELFWFRLPSPSLGLNALPPLLLGSGIPHFAAAFSAVLLWRMESKPAGV